MSDARSVWSAHQLACHVNRIIGTRRLGLYAVDYRGFRGHRLKDLVGEASIRVRMVTPHKSDEERKKVSPVRSKAM
jgi:hypothetical protein